MKTSCLDINHRGWGHRDNIQAGISLRRHSGWSCGRKNRSHAASWLCCSACIPAREPIRSVSCTRAMCSRSIRCGAWTSGNTAQTRSSRRLTVLAWSRFTPLWSLAALWTLCRKGQGGVVQSSASRRRSLPQPALYRGNRVQESWCTATVCGGDLGAYQGCHQRSKIRSRLYPGWFFITG